MPTASIAPPPLSKEYLTYLYQHYYDLKSEDCDKITHYLLDKEILNEYTPPVLFAFFKNCSLKQLLAQEEVFKENIHNPLFQQLLFSTSSMLATNKPYDKVATLLKWGWNPNQIYTEPSYRDSYNLLPYPKNATPLHVEQLPRICELLIEHGANTKALCSINNRYKPIIDSGMLEIKNEDDALKFIEIVSNDKYSDDYQRREYAKCALALPNNKDYTISIFNNHLVLAQKEFTPYELAIHLNQKQKYLCLRQYENQMDISAQQIEKINAIKECVGAKKLLAAKKLLLVEIKNKNPYAIKAIEELKPIVDAELLFTAIRNNYGNWVKEIIERGWVAKNAASKVGNKESLIMCAANRNRPTIFKYLDKEGYNEGIDFVVASLNSTMDFYAKDYQGNIRSPEDVLADMPTGIIYYLAKKGYTFNNDKIMRFIIELEKDKLEEHITQVVPSSDKPVKKFKI